jgi:hypothetical protein
VRSARSPSRPETAGGLRVRTAETKSTSCASRESPGSKTSCSDAKRGGLPASAFERWKIEAAWARKSIET